MKAAKYVFCTLVVGLRIDNEYLRYRSEQADLSEASSMLNLVGTICGKVGKDAVVQLSRVHESGIRTAAAAAFRRLSTALILKKGAILGLRWLLQAWLLRIVISVLRTR